MSQGGARGVEVFFSCQVFCVLHYWVLFFFVFVFFFLSEWRDEGINLLDRVCALYLGFFGRSFLFLSERKTNEKEKGRSTRKSLFLFRVFSCKQKVRAGARGAGGSEGRNNEYR